MSLFLLYGLSQIRPYQWVQDSVERLDLNLVVAQRLSKAELDLIVSSFRRDVDEQMCVRASYLDDIPCTRAGRHRFVVGMGDGPEQSK